MLSFDMELEILFGPRMSVFTITEFQEELQPTEGPIQFTHTTRECNLLKLLGHEENMLGKNQGLFHSILEWSKENFTDAKDGIFSRG